MQAVDQLNLDGLRVAIDKDDDSRPASAHPISVDQGWLYDRLKSVS